MQGTSGDELVIAFFLRAERKKHPWNLAFSFKFDVFMKTGKEKKIGKILEKKIKQQKTTAKNYLPFEKFFSWLSFFTKCLDVTSK